MNIEYHSENSTREPLLLESHTHTLACLEIHRVEVVFHRSTTSLRCCVGLSCTTGHVACWHSGLKVPMKITLN